jgi:aquaporin related protein
MEGHFIAAVAEFAGTFMFLYMGYAGNLMTSLQAVPAVAPDGDGPASQTVVFTALSYSLALLVNVWAFYRISGGLCNPAVSTSGAFSSLT